MSFLKSNDVTKHIIFHISKTFYNYSKIIVLSKLKIKKTKLQIHSSKYHIKNFGFPKKKLKILQYLSSLIFIFKSQNHVFSLVSHLTP